LGHLGGRETPTGLLGHLVDVAHGARVQLWTGGVGRDSRRRC
jgi:hypothetical protein